jgi:hypothetical protein
MIKQIELIFDEIRKKIEHKSQKSIAKMFVIGVGKILVMKKKIREKKSYKHLSGKLSCFERETLQCTTKSDVTKMLWNVSVEFPNKVLFTVCL